MIRLIQGKNDELYTKIMTIKQIHQAWRQSKNSPFIGDTDKMNEKSPHYKFAEEFCLKTVIAGAAKFIINTSDDSDLALAEAINKETAGDLTNAAPDGVVIDAAAVASDTAPEPEPKEEPNPGAAIGSSNLHPIEGAPVEGDGLFPAKKKGGRPPF
jgi:recombinational DNA repair protein RecT